jgi:two-component sensor histidine kinase
MGNSISAQESLSAQEPVFQFPLRCTVEPATREQTQHNALTAELQAARVREEAWLREKRDLLQHQDTLAQEFEHRLINSLQIIVSLLSLQSRTATPEAGAQLAAAARRVASFGRVHHQLHLLDHQESVEFKQYLQHLCEDLSALLFQGEPGYGILVEAAKIDIPTVFAIPLGFIVNELITNSAKYAKSNITVRLETTPTFGHSLTVLDDGPGLPAGFDPAESKGLGMKIIRTLVKQIGGELQSGAGENRHGARFTVTFCSPRSDLDRRGLTRNDRREEPCYNGVPGGDCR